MKIRDFFDIRKKRKWNDRVKEKWLKHDSRELIFNRNEKWKGNQDYSFLLEVKESLEKLTIKDYSLNVDVSAIEKLTNLTHLRLELGKTTKHANSYPTSLKELYIAYHKGITTPDALPQLEVLNVWDRCLWSDLTFLSRLPKLRIVSLDCHNKSCFKLFSKMPFLEEAEVSGTKKIDLASLNKAHNLKKISFYSLQGKVDLAELSALSSIEYLCIDGKKIIVDTLEPLVRLNKLKWLYLGNTTINDKNIEMLGDIENLEYVFFKDANYMLNLSEICNKFGLKRIGLPVK